MLPNIVAVLTGQDVLKFPDKEIPEDKFILGVLDGVFQLVYQDGQELLGVFLVVDIQPLPVNLIAQTKIDWLEGPPVAHVQVGHYSFELIEGAVVEPIAVHLLEAVRLPVLRHQDPIPKRPYAEKNLHYGVDVANG